MKSYKFWLYYCAVLSTLIVIGGFYLSSANNSRNLIIANTLLLPIVLFCWLLVRKYRQLKITDTVSERLDEAKKGILETRFGFGLLVYSLVMSTIISAGGFIISRSNQEIISNILFLPITVFCWYLYYIRPKKTERQANSQTGSAPKVIVNAVLKAEPESSMGEEKHGIFDSERMKTKTWDIDELTSPQVSSKNKRSI